MVPDPAVVVLIGASGTGKSTWAAARYRAAEIVSSDDLRGVVGSGRHDLDASTDAFRLLEDILAARARRGLTCVVDTLGLDPARRAAYRAVAAERGLPAVAVLFDVAAGLARSRNAARDRPVPSAVLTGQLRRMREIRAELAAEGWDEVVEVTDASVAVPRSVPTDTVEGASGLQVILQVSRFPWGDDPADWLRDVALAADTAGFAGLALMDHLIQIPQVERAWSPIPEPWVTLGLLAGLDTRLRLGTLVSPVTFRPAGVLAKTAATLDALSGGRAFLGLGAGWWEREHDAFGLPFPPPPERLDALAAAIATIRALWAPGTKAAAGLPETTCYPRPVGELPIIVGARGPRMLRLAARLGDAVNVPLQLLDSALATGAEVTVLDIPVTGHDRDEVWARVEALRGRTAAATFARAHHAGTHAEQRERYLRLEEVGVTTVFLAPPHLRGADDIAALAPMVRP